MFESILDLPEGNYPQLKKEKTSTRFTLVAGCWYAAKLIGDDFADSPELRSCSPIRVDRVQPKEVGHGRFDLSFYHANYPEGLRDKMYSLQTLERGKCFILAKSTTHRPARLLLIYDISYFSLVKSVPLRGQPVVLEQFSTRPNICYLTLLETATE